MSRIANIDRYREKTLDLAALVAGLSAARLDESGRLGELMERKDAQLYDLIHDLAFNARKLIELVVREGLSSIEYATRSSIMCSQESDTSVEDWPLQTMSLRDICGRIIHSDRFSIERGRIPSQDGILSAGEASWGFRVASDRDPPGTTIFVWIEFLLSDLLVFDEHLVSDLEWAGLNNPERAGKRENANRR